MTTNPAAYRERLQALIDCGRSDPSDDQFGDDLRSALADLDHLEAVARNARALTALYAELKVCHPNQRSSIERQIAGIDLLIRSSGPTPRPTPQETDRG